MAKLDTGPVVDDTTVLADLWRDQFLASCANAAYFESADAIRGVLDIAVRGGSRWQTDQVLPIPVDNHFAFVATAFQSADVVIAFRGTYPWYSPTDWKDNLQAWLVKPSWADGGCPNIKGQVHKGFNDAWGKLRASVMDALDHLRLREDTRLFFTGHSLGAAIAQLASLNDYQRPLVTRHLTTFSSPLVGDTVFQENFAELRVQGDLYEARDEILGIQRLNAAMELLDFAYCRPMARSIPSVHGLFRYWHSIATYVQYFDALMESHVSVAIQPTPGPPPMTPIPPSGLSEHTTEREELKRGYGALSQAQVPGLIAQPGDPLNELRIVVPQAHSYGATALEVWIPGANNASVLLSTMELQDGLGPVIGTLPGSGPLRRPAIGELRYLELRLRCTTAEATAVISDLIVYANGVPLSSLNVPGEGLVLDGMNPRRQLMLNAPQYQMTGVVRDATDPKIPMFRRLGSWSDQHGRDVATDYSLEANVVRYPSGDTVVAATTFTESRATGGPRTADPSKDWPGDGVALGAPVTPPSVIGRIYQPRLGDKPMGYLNLWQGTDLEVYKRPGALVGFQQVTMDRTSKRVLSHTAVGIVDAPGVTATTIAAFYDIGVTNYQYFKLYTLAAPTS